MPPLARPALPALAAALALAALAAAAAEHLRAKPGLWEFTHETEASGGPAMADDMLARMPPEARARIEAARQRTASQTTRACLTEDDLAHGFHPGERAGSDCKTTVVSRTATGMNLAIECADIGPSHASSKGTAHWEAPAPDAMTATVDMTIAFGGKTMTRHSKIAGHFVQADCGDVKPRQPH
ncbi:MAG: DUF3617 domain-containing protein [Proteobacteria bacterium]|nr:DUF3617 domain-containing protein [Pseudomonadota bacterium]